MAAITFDAVDTAYYKTQLFQIRETAELLLEIKTKGVMGVTKVKIDEYFKATWDMNYATWTYELKTQCAPICMPCCCQCHNYCCGCCACFFGGFISNRRNKIVADQVDVKSFLRTQEIRSRGFSLEQLAEMKNRVDKALNSNDMALIMREAEELDQMDRNLSSVGNASQYQGMMQGMMQMTLTGQAPVAPMQGMHMQGMNQGMPMQGMHMQGMPMQGMPMQGMPMQGMPMQGMPMQGQQAYGQYPSSNEMNR